MNQGKAEQFSGALAVAMAIKLPAQVRQVEVEGQGVCGEGPCGKVDKRGGQAQAGGDQAVAQGHTLSQARVDDRHHAVPSPRVVGAKVPAESVEVGELPSVQDPCQQPGT